MSAKWENDIKEEIQNVLFKAQRINNSNKIRFESLNWNNNPDIKEAAERLGIFENAPSFTKPLNLNTLDSEPNKLLDELGVLKKPNLKSHLKAKTVHFRDFVNKMVGDANQANLDVIDAEIVKEPTRIRLKE